jgi:hypothetical protein
MITQRFGATVDFLMERNTDCIPDDVYGSTSVAGGRTPGATGRKFAVDSKIKRGLVIVVRNAG